MANPHVNNEDAIDASSTTERQSGHNPPDGSKTTGMDWLNYLLIAAAASTVTGTILVIWGDHENSLFTVATGAVLFTVATVAWIGAFLFVSYKMLRMLAPSLIRWFRRFL